MDDDEELLRLQNEFMQAQEVQLGARLSERVCVDLILKLVEEKRIEIIFAASGREYVTPRCLRREVCEAVKSHSGRLCLVDIPALLGVDLHHIENAAKSLVNNDDDDDDDDGDDDDGECDFILLNGELISNKCIENAVIDVWDSVRQCGQRSLAEMAQLVHLPITFLLDAIQSRTSLAQGGSVRAQMLYTNEFVCTHNARTRAVMLALTRLTPLQPLCAMFQLQQHLFMKEVERLLAANLLPGSLHGHGIQALYQPEVFLRAQVASVTSFFKQNDFISNERLRSVGVDNFDTFMLSHCSDAIKLSSSFVSIAIRDNVLACVEEALNESSWSDCSMVLPSSLAIQDIEQLIALCVLTVNKTSVDAKMIQVEKIFVVSTAFRNDFFEKVKPFVLTLAKEAANKLRSDTANAKKNVSSDVMLETSSSATARNRSQHNIDSDDSSNDDNTQHKRRKGGAKRRNNKRSNKRNAKRNSNSENIAEHKSSQPQLDVSSLLPLLYDVIPECPQNFVCGLVNVVQNECIKYYNKQRDSIFTDNSYRVVASEKYRKKHNAMVIRVAELHENVTLFAHAIDKFALVADDNLIVSLNHHILRSICTNLVHVLLRNQALHYELTLDDDDVDVNKQRSLSSSDALNICARLPSRVGRRVEALLASLHESTRHTFDNLVKSIAEECEIPLPSLTRKKEKALLFHMRQQLLKQIQEESSAPPLLLLVTIALHLEIYGTILHAPSRLITELIEHLKPRVTPQAFDTLHNVDVAIQNESGDVTLDDAVRALRTLGRNPKAALIES